MSGIFGEAIFGDVIFADLGAVNRRPGRRRGGIGGQGFPENTEALLRQAARDDDRERRRLEHELAEIIALVEAGLL